MTDEGSGRQAHRRDWESWTHWQLESIRPDLIFHLYLEVDKITTSRARRRRSTISSTPVQTTRRACMGPSTCLAWRSERAASFSRPPRARSMAIRASIPARVLLGQRQPDRTARLLRRGKRCAETLCFRRRPVITKAEETWASAPKIGLDEGLTRTVPYFENYLRRYQT
jgi:hypothetical protein